MSINKDKRFHFLVNMLIWLGIFTIVPSLVQTIIFNVLPFDYFIDIEHQEIISIEGDMITFETVRDVRFDIEAHAIKELYKIEDHHIQMPENKVSDFVFEEGKDGELFQFKLEWAYEITEPGEYYIIDHITINPPFSKPKTKTITTNVITI